MKTNRPSVGCSGVPALTMAMARARSFTQRLTGPTKYVPTLEIDFEPPASVVHVDYSTVSDTPTGLAGMRSTCRGIGVTRLAHMDTLDYPTLKSPNGPTREQIGAPADNE